MDFVTVSDHDSIAGGLEIAHLPGTFLSSEVTARFPEDGCLVHCLVIGVSEAQFAEIDRLRGNLYELRDYLCEQEILCSVAHPLYRVNDRLTAAHWEKLLLLFKRFELLNGAREPPAGRRGGLEPQARPLLLLDRARVPRPAAGRPQRPGRPRRRAAAPGARRRPGPATELVPHLAALAPYLASFHTQHKDDGFLRDLAAHQPARQGEAARRVVTRPRKKAWFTDTLGEVNGVARTIRETAALAREKGADLTVVTATNARVPAGLPVANFRPLRELALPEYESIPLALPPFLELLDHCEQEGFTEVIVSTPGPVGLAGLAAARLLGLPATGIYHTDFPAYAGLLTGNPFCEQLAHGYMKWFYGACARVYAPSRAYAEMLRRAGLPGERLRLLPRGVDHRLFHPGRRRPELWRECGLAGSCRFLYVGRVSKEKNLDLLLAAFHALLARRPDADLIVVGDGPYLEELAARHCDPRILFTGFLHGSELATAYASADVFVFPSATDTFGNAVLEAHASGLPAVVADAGGPPEIVREHRSGLVFDPTNAGELAAALERLMLDRELRATMGRRALEHAREASWENLLAELWGEEPDSVGTPAANEEDPAAAEGWEELLATA